MTHRRIAALLVSAVVAAGLGCQRKDAARRYALVGVVQETKADSGEAVVAHGDIPGFMQAMTMTFKIKGDPSGIRPGDRIEATLAVTDAESWLERIEVKERGLAVAAPKSAGRGAEPGTAVPNFTLTNQDGEPIQLNQYQGRTLAVSFIYTRCPIPEFCPFLMKNFKQLDEALAKDRALFDKTHLLTVSFDPKHDTPPVLRRYGAAFAKDRGKGRFDHWELATGTPEQVKDVAVFFGLEYWGEGTEIAHSLRTGIIGPTGKLVRIFNDNNWTADDALASIRSAEEGGA
jgi:protein SCO1